MPVCELCRCEVEEMTTHYLMPRARRKRKRTKDSDTRAKGRPVNLCRPCHKQVHMLTEKEAAQYF